LEFVERKKKRKLYPNTKTLEVEYLNNVRCIFICNVRFQAGGEVFVHHPIPIKFFWLILFCSR
jgi:hypothetical protein